MNGLGKTADKSRTSALSKSGAKSRSIFEALQGATGTSIFEMLRDPQGGTSIFEDIRLARSPKNAAKKGKKDSLLQVDWKKRK